LKEKRTYNNLTELPDDKFCNSCGHDNPITDFYTYKKPNGKIRIDTVCKAHRTDMNKRTIRDKNEEKAYQKKYQKKYYKENPKKKKLALKRSRDWLNKKYKTDIQWRDMRLAKAIMYKKKSTIKKVIKPKTKKTK